MRPPADPAALKTGSDLEIALRIRETIEHQRGTLISSGNNFYCWTDKEWKQLTGKQLFHYVRAWDGQARSVGKKKVEISAPRLKSILKLLNEASSEPEFFAEPVCGVPLQDGFLKFTADGSELVPHHPDHRNRYVLPVVKIGQAYEPKSRSLLLNKLLEGCFRGDEEAQEKRLLLQEIAGAIVAGGTQILTEPKAVILQGPSAENGKSQVLEALRGLVPDYASCSLSPADMSDEKLLCALEGKLLNASDEIGGRAIGGETFKSVVTGDLTRARGIYQSVVFFRPQALNIFTCNAPPPFKNGMDRGIRRRLLILPFERTIPKSERINKIGCIIAEHEREALIDWAVQGAERLVQQGGFTDLQSSRQALRDWLRTEDPFAEWLSEESELRITGEAEDRVDADKMYLRFRVWCQKNGIRNTDVPAKPVLIGKINNRTYQGVRTQRKARGRWVYGIAECTQSAPGV